MSGHHHRQHRPVRAQPRQDLEAVDAGHVAVEQDQPERVAVVGGRLPRVERGLEIAAQAEERTYWARAEEIVALAKRLDGVMKRAGLKRAAAKRRTTRRRVAKKPAMRRAA